MSEDPDHEEACHKNRVARQGLILSEVALSMARGIRCLDEATTEAETSEALGYLVDATIHIALHNKNPRLVIEQIVMRLDGYPIEELTQLIAQHSGRHG